MIPVILSGGVGSRLWPLSRGMYPKQLLSLVDVEKSLLQQTVERGVMVAPDKPPIVVCNEQHRFMVAEQLQQSNRLATIILEPEGKNTAPAIALAAHQAMLNGEDPLLLVMPADHVIVEGDGFHSAVQAASRLAEQGKLVTFGVVPTHAETGYGYIKAGEPFLQGSLIEEFVEKPIHGQAQAYLDEGGYFWNGGIFLFHASAYLRELSEFVPDVYAASFEAIQNAQQDLDFLRVDAESFAASSSISIDYAVMERTSSAAMVSLDAGWNDIGSWSALWDISEKDLQGNATRGDVLLVDTSNSHIYAESKLVATVGVDNLVVVQTDDAILITNRTRSQDVKLVVEKLALSDRHQTDHHRKVYRPWGWYDSIDAGERFQVKRIMVKPGAKLSVQKHNHRAEHWVVVSGEAEVLNGNATFILKENESTYIPIGVTHSLANPSKSTPLEIIEVQSGSYLGEDDIVRFDDQYGRTGRTD